MTPWAKAPSPFRFARSIRTVPRFPAARCRSRFETAAASPETRPVRRHRIRTALVEVPAGKVAEVQVQTASETDVLGRAARAFGLGNTMPEMPLPANFIVDTDDESADFIAPGTNGVAVGAGDKVWYVPMEPGQPPHPVANLPFFIDGMWGNHIDDDGILDLAIWADTQVVLLRGRAEAGYGWGGAWTTGDRDVAGVTPPTSTATASPTWWWASAASKKLVGVMLGEGSGSATEPSNSASPSRVSLL